MSLAVAVDPSNCQPERATAPLRPIEPAHAASPDCTITPYSTEDWTHTGIVTANTCGKAVAKPEPGVLKLFVRPLNFWEKLSE